MAEPVTEMAKLYPEAVVAGMTSVVAYTPPPVPILQPSMPCWYVASTRPRHEKVVYDQLLRLRIESFLPVYESLRQWHDRKKRILLPTFPGYIFVRIPFDERRRVLQVAGITRMVEFGGRPAMLPQDELEQLRAALSLRKCEPHPYFPVGQRVKIISGPLRGLCGVVQRARKLRLIISVDCLCRAVAVELEGADLLPA